MKRLVIAWVVCILLVVVPYMAVGDQASASSKSFSEGKGGQKIAIELEVGGTETAAAATTTTTTTTTTVAAAAAAEEELKELDRLIALQQRRVELARQLRDTQQQQRECQVDGTCTAPSAPALQKTVDPEPVQSSKQPPQTTVRETKATSNQEEEEEEEEDDEAIFLSQPRVSQLTLGGSPVKVTCQASFSIRLPRGRREHVLKKKKKRSSLAYQHLLVSGLYSGEIVVSDATGLHLQVIPPVIGFAADGTPKRHHPLTVQVTKAYDGYLVSAGYTDGTIQNYGLRSWFEKALRGAQPQLQFKLSPGTAIEKYALSGRKEDTRLVPLSTERANNAVPTTLGLYSHRRHTLLFVGYSNGRLRVYTSKGSTRLEIDSHNDTVLASALMGSGVAFSTERGFGCHRLSARSRTPYLYCETASPVRAMAFHPVKTTVLYATNTHGQLLVFNVRRARNRTHACTPRAVEVVTGAHEPISIHATNGFLFLTSRTHMFVYNVSSERWQEPLFLLQVALPGNDKTDSPAFLQTFIHGASAEAHVSVTTSHGAVLDFRSFLPMEGGGSDKKGILGRVPMMLVGALVVFAWNFMRKRRSAGAGHTQAAAAAAMEAFMPTAASGPSAESWLLDGVDDAPRSRRRRTNRGTN